MIDDVKRISEECLQGEDRLNEDLLDEMKYKGVLL